MSTFMYFSRREAIRRAAHALATSFNISGRGEEADAALSWMRACLDDNASHPRSRMKRHEAAYRAALVRRKRRASR